MFFFSFFFNATAPTDISTLSLHDALPICIPHHSLDSHLGKLIARGYKVAICEQMEPPKGGKLVDRRVVRVDQFAALRRSEEHTSELQSPDHLVWHPQLETNNEEHIITPPT